MIYKTKDGIAFHVLPDNARCACEGVHPDVLSECPMHILTMMEIYAYRNCATTTMR